MAIHSPMGLWGKELSLKGTGDVLTSISQPALVQQGDELLIHIKNSVHEPLIIKHFGQDGRVTVRIITEPSVEATIIEHIEGEIAHNVTVDLAQNSSIAYGLLQNGTYKGTKTALVAKDARMTWFELNQGIVQSRVHTTLLDNAQVRCNSVFLGDSGNHIDYGATAEHQGQYSNARLFTKGVLRSASAIYDGILNIKSTAAFSNAHQREDCLLLDDNAEIKAAPQLFIDNNEVQCSHACSTTKPDEALSFYVQSRGIPEKTAQALLVKAFVWPVLEALPQHLSCWLEKNVTDSLERYSHG